MPGVQQSIHLVFMHLHQCHGWGMRCAVGEITGSPRVMLAPQELQSPHAACSTAIEGATREGLDC